MGDDPSFRSCSALMKLYFSDDNEFTDSESTSIFGRIKTIKFFLTLDFDVDWNNLTISGMEPSKGTFCKSSWTS